MDTQPPECVLLTTTCIEKSSRKTDPWYVLVVTSSRIILSPISGPVHRKEPTAPAPGGERPSKSGSSWSGWPEGNPHSPGDSLEALVKDYRNREPETILAGKDAREICFDQVLEIDILRVRSDPNYSRWLSIFFPPYSFGPASARYRVDYQLTIVTSAGKFTLMTPFLLDLKQVLVDYLGNRVHETIDSTAPLL